MSAAREPLRREAKPELRRAISKRTTATRPAPAPSASAASAEPKTVDQFLVRGDLAFQQGDYRKALAAYSKAYQLNPYNREVRRKLVTVLTLLGRAEEARKYQ